MNMSFHMLRRRRDCAAPGADTAAGSHPDEPTVHRWWMLVAALVAAMATTCAVSGVAYLIPALHDDGVSLTKGAWLAALPTVGLTLSMVGWGLALDRRGERRVLLVSLALTVIATGATALAAAYHAPLPVIGACLLAGGLACGAGNGASGRIVVGWFPPNLRGTAMGMRQMAQPLGVGICALTMPVLAAHRGAAAALIIPFAVSVIALGLTALLIVDPRRPEPATGNSTAQSDPNVSENPYRTGGFLTRVHTVSLLLVIPQGMLWTFVPTWLIVGLHWSPGAAGLLVTITQILGALGRIAAGRVSDRMGSRMRPVRIIAVAAVVFTALLALTAWMHAPVVAVVAMMLASVISVADNGLAFTAIAEYAGPRWSGRSLAIQNTSQYLAMSATTPIFGALIAAAGFPLAFAVAAAAPLLAIGVVPHDPPTEN